MKIQKVLSYLVVLSLFFGSYAMDQKHIQHGSSDAKTKIMEMASAYILARAIHVAAGMGLADRLVASPLNISELAVQVGADQESLGRMLRLLASHGIFSLDANNTVSLTALAHPLVSGHQDSLRAWLAGHDNDPMHWQSFGHMEHSIRTGEPAFNHLFEQGYFDFLAGNASAAVGFDEGMRTIAAGELDAIVDAYNFSACKNIADLGGGKGGLLAALLAHNKQLQGLLCDLPHVMPSAQEYLAEQGCADRVQLVPGSFFDAVPTGADVYILKRILHDWSDLDCIKILQQCKKAMTGATRLLIVEAVVREGNVRDFAKEVDMAMMVLFGGKERTLTEWELLVQKAGLRILRVLPTASMLSIIEVSIA